MLIPGTHSGASTAGLTPDELAHVRAALFEE